MDSTAIRQSNAIYWASGIVSICGIIFEVLFGAIGSYILGDGVKQYTLTISLFLTGMGIGASISEHITKNLLSSFVWIEYTIALIGGFSTFLLFGINAYLSSGTDALFLYSITLLVGALTGVELPILIRKANEIGVSLNRSTARVLFSDYAGGLIGGLLFVYLLRPQLGMVKTAFFVAIINASVALWVLVYFRKEIKRFTGHAVVGIAILFVLVGGLFFGEEAAFSFEQKMYRDPIVYAEETDYQRIILTKEQGDLRLFLNGQLQFSSSDEYRYHEMLVHPAMLSASSHQNILILGGGDGLALRELQKYDSTKSITLVDLDPAIVVLAKEHPDIVSLNRDAFQHHNVKVIHQDAFEFMENTNEFYDVIIVDLPDPNNESLNKLYTIEFYSLLRNHLNPGGAMMIQATSPVFATEVYWTVDHTVKATGLHTENFHLDIPSFGNWGFILAKREPIIMENAKIVVETKFLTEEMMLAATHFGKDEDRELVNEKGKSIELEVNSLINPHLIELYEQAWLHY
ncbi:polyamine aminopropyltransferase [Bacillus pinisoli]|uniref:polyamine aminopropyltransferase n=1 Tax=Bacillus pinisoli TaxID=2901866 RepID=UPI001FF365B5|nr:polyamine aminopropyltransferase [Bacillus pinisoli]